MHRADGSAHRANGSVHRADDSVHRADSSAHRANGSVHRADSSAHRANGSVHRADSSAHRADGSADRANSSADRADGSAHRAGCRFQAAGRAPSWRPRFLAARCRRASRQDIGAPPLAIFSQALSGLHVGCEWPACVTSVESSSVAYGDVAKLVPRLLAETHVNTEDALTDATP